MSIGSKLVMRGVLARLGVSNALLRSRSDAFLVIVQA